MAEIAELENGRFKIHVRPVMSNGGMGGLADHQVAVNPYGLPADLRERFLERAGEISSVTIMNGEARFMASAIDKHALHELGRLLVEYSIIALPIDIIIETLRDYL